MNDQTRLDQTGLTALVWLHLLKEGGRHATAEIATVVHSTSETLAVVLTRLTDAGSLCRYEKSEKGDRVRYGVTAACKVPRGISIGEILACNLPETTE